MEFLIGFAVIVIILLILGINIETVIFGFMVLVGTAIALSGLVLLYYGVRLIFSRKSEALFTRIGRQEDARFDTAFYMVSETELPNVFPAEVILKNRLYSTDKVISLRVDPGGKFVFDRNSRLTILIGTPLCALLSFVIFWTLILILI